MRDSGQKRMTAILGGGLVFFMISGCAIKHSDVMLFGTNTKYGVSVAADQPENTPHLNVGYKRQEFVWMPLVANAEDSALARKVKGDTEAKDVKYIGKEAMGADYRMYDTYSVLASFGAKVKASKGAAGSGIAQYFATGIAAQNLATVGGASLVQASDVNLAPSPEVIEAANKAEVIRSRSAIDVEESRLGRLKIIQNKIKGLDAEKLKALAKEPPVQEKDDMDFVNKEIDPNKTRESDPEMAKKVLLILATENELSDANLEAWEKALGITTTE